MRDGIFKNMPQSREWRGLWRSCNREAERGEITAAKAERALLADLRKELGDKFTRRFLERCLETESQLPIPGLRLFGEQISGRDLGGENTPLEETTLRHARRLEESGVHGNDLAAESIACALKDWTQRQMRQMAQFCIDEAGDPARPVIEAARQAVDAQDVGSIARAHLGIGPKPASGKVAPITLDEDLTQPH